MSDTERGASDKRRRNQLYRHIGFICKDAGLDREDRLHLAKELFSGIDDAESYSDLTTADLEDILFVLKGWRIIQRIRMANGHLPTEAKVVVERLSETAKESAKRQDATGEWS